MRTPIFQLTVRLPITDQPKFDRMLVLGRWHSRNELAASLLHDLLTDDEAAHAVGSRLLFGVTE